MTDISPDSFATIAQAVYKQLPKTFRQLTKNILIRIDEFATHEVLEDLGIESPYSLLGLYHGIDITRKSGFDTLPHQDMIFLYRQPIIRFWQSGPDSLEQVIQHVLIHEVGHHFGLSDEDMHGLEDEARHSGE